MCTSLQHWKGIPKDDVLHIKSEALISAACCIECISNDPVEDLSDPPMFSSDSVAFN